MKRGESGSEESLDDILASIRKIIADEPGQATAPPMPDAPLVPQGTFASPISAEPREPAFSSSTEADKPRSAFGTPASTTSAVPATPSANGAMGIQLPSARDALSGASASSAKPAPAERSEGFGFFRAALSAQTQPASAPEETSLNGAMAAAAPSRSIAASIDDELADLIDEPAPVADGRGTTQVAPEPEAAPASSFSAREAAPSVEAAREKWSQLINPTLSVTPDGSRAAAQTTSAPAASAPVSAAPATSAPSTGIFAPRSGGFYPPQTKIEPSLAKPVAAPAPSDVTPATPAASASAKNNVTVEVPAATSAAKAEAASSEPPVADLPISTRIDTLAASNPTAAAAAALDALALGLAKTGERPPEPAPGLASSAAPADTLIGSTLAARPTTGPVPAPQAAPSAEPVAPAGPAAGPSPSVVPAAPVSTQPRTLEDVVADMVRPMLEKWIDENMPRIVERALKLDATSGPKS